VLPRALLCVCLTVEEECAEIHNLNEHSVTYSDIDPHDQTKDQSVNSQRDSGDASTTTNKW
jgi:hypothetical protein